MSKYKVGDVVSLKKGHPCGENRWTILRTGVDIKLECDGCKKVIWLKRLDFDRRIRKIFIDDEWVTYANYQPEESLIDISQKNGSSRDYELIRDDKIE